MTHELNTINQAFKNNYSNEAYPATTILQYQC